MKKVFIIFSLISFSLGSTINIPNDFPTIQLGIDAANNGDTVIVAQGIYYENITIDKEIFFTSNAILDDLGSDWINNQNIQGTIKSFMTGFGKNFQTNPGSRGSKRLVCILLQAIPGILMHQLH